MQDFRTLKLLDRFAQTFTHFGVDYKIMRKILQLKLLMDNRHVPTIFKQSTKNKGKGQKDGNGYLKSLWMYVLFGLFTIPLIVSGDNYFFQMSIVFGILMFLVMTSMISDFSSVLLDIRDQHILHPKPIDKKTISAAKMIHISIYLFFLTVSIIGIPLIVGLFIHGVVFFLVSVVSVLFIDILIIVLTALLYMVILKFFDGEKLKDIINYVQIGLSFSIMIGYQLLVRSFEFVDINVVLEPKWWQLFIFPMWYGAIVDIVMESGKLTSFYLVLIFLGLIIPIIAFVFYLRLQPAFERNLQKLSVHGKGKVKKRHKASEWLLTLICLTKEERAIFRFASLMMKNERDFKLKVYPSLGFSIILPFIFLINDVRTDSLANIGGGKSYLTIYFSLMIIPTVIMMLKYSGKYNGAWIYKVTPFKNLKYIFSGTMKAFLVKLYLPIHLFISFIFLWIFGADILPDLILVFMNACIYAVVCFLILQKSLPFSESFEAMQQNEGTKTFLLLLIAPLFAGLHYLSLLLAFGIYSYMLLAIIILVVLWRTAFNISWADIEG